MSVTSSSGAWRLPEWRGQREVLGADECLRLLDVRHVGRLAYCTNSGPRIVPMNYALAGDTLLFRTGYDTEAARHLQGALVASRSMTSTSSSRPLGAWSSWPGPTPSPPPRSA